MKNKFFKKKIEGKNRKGFTMIEVIISVFVVLVGLISVFELMYNNIKNNNDTRDRLIAVQLAQEGAELVHFIRDNNIAAAKESFSSLEEKPGSDRCAIFADSDFGSWKTSSNCNKSSTEVNPYYLYFDKEKGFYGDSSGGKEVTKFSRRVSIEDGGGSDEKVVRSFVSWDGLYYNTESNCESSKKCVIYRAILKK